MAPACERCSVVPAVFVVTVRKEHVKDDRRTLDLCAGCAAGAMERRFVASVVDGIAVWGPT